MPESPLDAANTTYLWARSLIEELVRTGVDTFFVAPGSRSTPLTVSAAQHPNARVIVHVDERGTAFAALGYGRSTARAAAWITTSGTAVANGLPAVVEASVDGVPMICLTADRPPELRGSGANQTIDQVRIFGSYPRHFVDLPPPTSEIPLAAILAKLDEAVHRAHRLPRGPVHVNAAFRKPLEPSTEGTALDVSERIRRWAASGEAFTQRSPSEVSVPPAAARELAERVGAAERGLVVAGRLDTPEEADAVRHLAGHLEWPVLPDITSQLRLGSAPEIPRVAHFDAVLAGEGIGSDWHPDVVLHIGGRFLSKRLRHLLRDAVPDVYAVIRPDPSRIDPDHHVTHHVEAAPISFCRHLIDAVSSASRRSSWTTRWTQADGAVADMLTRHLTGNGTSGLSEPAVARLLSQEIPASHALVLASSMPVRDANRYADVIGSPVHVFANRGASGIDGTFATAAGCSIGREAPTTLLIGDLASLHDLSSLALLQSDPVVAVIINNNGGGIFHFLPIAEHEDVFEPYFATPQPVHFDRLAAGFDIKCVRSQTSCEFVRVYRRACGRAEEYGESTVLEVVTDRAENRNIHDRLDAACAEAVSSLRRA
ncbi:MAG: 2-succinyl-5-enolpyruvyl-6-hydroxy-3-cyclohexene-1-carboxylic-acid synthase [Bacteroidetes bacterium]|nr:2-succinyl-5-enolpyruvyl-6-hydroxy-3-cyclohexene-1-carboxylic-acid synthase [Bacteroidota bacterium]